MNHLIRLLALCLLCCLLLAGCAPQTPEATAPPTDTPEPTHPPLPTSTPLPPTATPPPTPTAVSPEVITEIDTILGNYTRQNLFSGSVLISQQGTVLLSKGYGLADRDKNIPNTPQTRYRIASITKQFTAMAILILQAQGKLDIQDRLCKYFESCPAAWEAITLEHLLTHTSGLPPLLIDAKDPTEWWKTPAASDQVVERFRDLPLEYAPGEEWRYTNTGYLFLAYVIEQASGQTYEMFLQQTIFTPLGLSGTGFASDTDALALGYPEGFGYYPVELLADISYFNGAGTLISTVEDLSCWEQALHTEQLVPQVYLDAMFEPRVPNPYFEGYYYGYGWEIGVERGRQIRFHLGNMEGYSAILVHYPEDDLTIIILSNNQRVDSWLIQTVLAKRLLGEK
jgi:CubicO group peptidase (beta-lactamase class C family)